LGLEESGGDDQEGRDEISLLAEVLVQLSVKGSMRPVRRGIFVSIDNVNKVWVPFKYENLPMFCFGCGRMGHGLKNCTQIIPARKSKIIENPPYTLALKA
ncbi:hypothetical protein Goshw_026519, partial [Gossypium schwendimanii]|nr:hypothetical protein [Gossypium schwendimanii]